jgi:predicted nucleic acid-binding protein
MRLLVDTDILIDHLRGARRFDPSGTDVSISTVTRTELYSGQRADEATIDLLLAGLEEIGVDRSIAERAGRLRRRTGLAITDAFIAATALEHGLPLVTRNRRHFDRVEGLDIRSTIEPVP